MAVPLFPREISLPGFWMRPPVPVTIMSLSEVTIPAPRSLRASTRCRVSSETSVFLRIDFPSASDAMTSALWV